MASGFICVLGGINLDLHLTALRGEMLRGTSNPARLHLAAGGVGRNIAEHLARWGSPTLLLGVTGDDPLSDRVLAETAEAGVDVARVLRVPGAACGLYAALLDSGGELAMAASAMEVTERFDAQRVRDAADAIAGAALLVVEANLGAAAIAEAIRVADAARVPVVLEPVSVAKAERLRGIDARVHVVTPNSDEAAALLGGASRLRPEWTIVTRGAQAVELFRGAPAGRNAEPWMRLPVRPVAPVDVTGAGDALTAGVAHAIAAGTSMEAAVRFGIAMARRTVLVAGSVSRRVGRSEAERELRTAREAASE